MATTRVRYELSFSIAVFVPASVHLGAEPHLRERELVRSEQQLHSRIPISWPRQYQLHHLTGKPSVLDHSKETWMRHKLKHLNY